jgi:hypothetical protein
MKYVFSFFIGAVTAAGGVFLHLSYPPAGLMLALAGTAATFWSVGKYYGKKRYRLATLAGWLVVLNDATNFGEGGELLVQGDKAGLTFLASSLAIVIVAIFLPAKG